MTYESIQREIAHCEERAALLERQATEREDSAPLISGLRSIYVQSFDIAAGYRKEAKELRERAADLRRRLR